MAIQPERDFGEKVCYVFNNKIPEKIEIWTNFGTISGGKQKWPDRRNAGTGIWWEIR
jgi:hypothetical protein